MQSPRIALLAVAALTYTAQSFAITDCSKPKSKIDWMLCSSDRAAGEEQRMARAFRDAVNRTEDRRQLLDEQRDWTERVRDVCNEIPCLIKAYQDRTEDLESR